MYMLHDLEYGKIVNRCYPGINHLPGSKLLDSGDKHISKEMVKYFTEKAQFYFDTVIVTEKLDGSNVAVLRKGYRLYPLNRRGYDVRTSEYRQQRLFADFVEKNYERFMNILKDGEQASGEWLIKTHSIKYKLKHEPFVLFDIFDKNENRIRYQDMVYKANSEEFATPKLLHMGVAIGIEQAMGLLGDGYHGSLDKPEGVVYRYERDGQFYAMAKYVRPDFECGIHMDNAEEWNEWKRGTWKVPQGLYLD